MVCKNSRKTGPVSSAPPEEHRSSVAAWRRAAAPFALSKNSRKTGPVSSAPPEEHRSSVAAWRRATAPFALRTLSGNFARLAGFLLATSLLGFKLPADPVPVRFQEGSVHGFLALRTLDGKLVASGDLTQVIKKDRAVSHLVFRFKDGSLDDETATFSQRGVFRVLSDHHIQKGPSFPMDSDATINAVTGQVTVRYREKGGKEKVEKKHMDIPPDLANGIILDVIKNISPSAKETTLSYFAATPEPRIVKLIITPQGKATFSVAGARHQASRFNAKVELGGLTGMFASMVGKQPADTQVWVVGGEAPAFVRSEGPLFLGGPIWSIQMTSPVWQEAPSSQ